MPSLLLGDNTKWLLSAPRSWTTMHVLRTCGELKILQIILLTLSWMRLGMCFQNIDLTYIHYCLLRNPVLAAPTAVMGAQPSGIIYIAVLEICGPSSSATSQTSAYCHSKLCHTWDIIVYFLRKEFGYCWINRLLFNLCRLYNYRIKFCLLFFPPYIIWLLSMKNNYIIVLWIIKLLST